MSDRSRIALRHVSRKEKDQFLAPPAGGWMPYGKEMLASPAWNALSRAGHLMITRLVLEHLNHAGHENGRLAVGWDDFVAAGIHRSVIGQTLAEVEQLGFVRRVAKGRRGFGSAIGERALYRITFAGVVGSDASGSATNDWRAVTAERAAEIVSRTKSGERARKAKQALRGVDAGQDIERGTEYRTAPKVRNTVPGKLAS